MKKRRRTSAPAAANGNNGKKRPLWRRLVLWFFLIVLPVCAGAAIGGLMAFARTVPSVQELREGIAPDSGTKLLADDETVIGEIKPVKGLYLPISRMPQHLLNAVVAVEDSHFWTHSGVDYIAIARAAAIDLLKRSKQQGASTITQQLAKMIFLTPEKTFKRKLREVILAHRMEKNLGKEEILELYLNRAYFGHGAYGVEMASRTYFGHPAKDLTTPESAILAGLLKAPANYSPVNDFERAKQRQTVVLKRMEEEGYISREELAKAQKETVYLARQGRGADAVNYFIDYVREYLINKYGTDTLYGSGGLKVYTTLNLDAQIKAQESLRQGLREYDKRRGYRGPLEKRKIDPQEELKREMIFKVQPPLAGDIIKGIVISVNKKDALIKTDSVNGRLGAENSAWAKSLYNPKGDDPKVIANFTLDKILSVGDVIMVKVLSVEGGKVEFALEQEPMAEGAVVAMDPHTGYIRVMVGGFDYGKSEYNRAIRASRQAGSAFKPFIFSLALQSGFTPASVIVDEEIKYDLPGGKEWKPQNYDNEFKGPMRLREALAISRNIITIKLLDAIGIHRLIKFSRKMGINTEMQPDFSIALGTLSIPPLDLTAAYLPFANAGVKVPPVAVKYITDQNGKMIENNAAKGEPVMDAQSAFLTTSLLHGVVTSGTGWRAKALGVPVAGKTGTTNDYRDAWFIGYTADLLTGVWVGMDEPKPLGPDETGSKAALPIWVDFMKHVVDKENPKHFPIPPGIVTRMIDPENGLLAGDSTENPELEYFRDGTEPQEVSPSLLKGGGEQGGSLF